MVRANALDLWICHHFQVLPTDDRFKRLSLHAKILLYRGYEVLPSDDDIKFLALDRDRKAANKLPVDDLAKRGYSKEEIEYFEQQIKNAGLNTP